MRLLVIKSAAFGAVQAKLVTVHKDSSPPYEAISYRWGESEKSADIIVEDSRIPVTDHVLQILLARRSFFQDRVIWIDSICINQDDHSEKAEQVRMMCDIYRNASRVMAIPSTDPRLRMVVSLLYRTLNDKLWAPDHTAQYRSIIDLEQAGAYKYAVQLEWRQFARLLHMEYFQRAWIIQEVSLAHKTEIYLCGLSVPWEVFHLACVIACESGQLYLLQKSGGNSLETTKSMFDQITVLSTLRRPVEANDVTRDKWTSLTNFVSVTNPRDPSDLRRDGTLLSLCKDFKASDDRDKAFAIYGLAADVTAVAPKSRLVEPDYRLSTEQVYMLTARNLFLNDDDPAVNLLSLASCRCFGERKMKASWVPCLRQDDDPFLRFTNVWLKQSKFNASGRRRASIAKGPISDSLLLRGTISDCILSLSANAFQVVESNKDLLKFMDSAYIFASYYSHRTARGQQIHQALLADQEISQDLFDEWRSAWTKLCGPPSQSLLGMSPADLSRRYDIVLYHNPKLLELDSLMWGNTRGRAFALTERGRFCLVPISATTGDIVFVPDGAQTPYVIREQSRDGLKCYEVIGEAYVQGIMQGGATTPLLESEYLTII